MKDTFSRHGIPTEPVSDNGSQYASYKFRQFVKQWEFKHVTSSPYYPQSNGLAESSVKTVKRTIKKSIESNQDIKQSLLILRNSPLKNGRSPAELLMGRKLHDILPTYVQPPVGHPTRDIIKERQIQKQYFDRSHSTNEQTAFRKDQPVAIQDHHTKEWSTKGTIIAKIAPRSYTIKLANGKVTRRNVKDIRKVHTLTLEDSEPVVTISTLRTPGSNALPTRHETDEESDSDETIPYVDSDSDDERSEERTPGETRTEDSEKTYVTTSGRQVNRKTPVDYEDL